VCACADLLVPIEQDIPRVLDEDAVPGSPVKGLPNWCPVVEVVLAQLGFQVGRRLDCIVERHLREQMVSDVGILDVMEGVIEEPAIVTVHRRQGSPHKVPGMWSVVWQVDICMLKQRDGHEPSVDKQVRDSVKFGHGPEGREMDGGRDESHDDQETGV